VLPPLEPTERDWFFVAFNEAVNASQVTMSSTNTDLFSASAMRIYFYL
jgi:hypothetical protein